MTSRVMPALYILLSTISYQSSSKDIPSSAFYKSMESINSDLKSATTCLPQISKDKISFCTGVDLRKNTLHKINKDITHCQDLIKNNGYQIVREGDHAKIDKKIWDSFYKTTKRAETLHNHKLVFFKKGSTQVDCAHELIHVLQWSSIGNHPLSPYQRTLKYKNFETILLKESNQVALLEKAKKIDKSQVLATKIQKGIDLLKNYSEISSWLDEKDVYYTFYKLCNKIIACSKEDWDTVIGNLFKINKQLPWRFRNEVIAQAIHLLKEKEESHFDQVKFIPLDKIVLKNIDFLFGLEWSALIKFVTNKGINIYQFKMREQVINHTETELIPETIFEKLPKPKKAHLLHLVNYSKISKSYTLGKFICDNNNKTHFIIVSNNTSKTTFIHEYIHYLQSRKNPSYCEAITNQNEISLKYKTGEISRKEFEHKIIRYKVLIWKSEAEVYRHIVKRADLNQFEIISNKHRYLKTKLNLTKFEKNKNIFKLQSKKISFDTIDNLPLINILNGRVVLDLGSMDSIIKPQLILQHYHFDKIKPIKLKNLQNSLGKTKVSTEVMLLDSVKIGDKGSTNSKWILEDLKLPKLDGVLGLNVFQNKEFVLYPKKKVIVVTKFSKRPIKALDIQRDYDNSVRAIEFICTPELIIRLDSGSQIEGDINLDLSQKTIIALANKGIDCGGVKIVGTFNSDLQNKGIFDRDVGLNVGWPWISKFRKISISLKNSWIYFEN